MKTAGGALLKGGSSPLRTDDVTVLKASVIASGIDKGVLDWTAPETVATVKGDIQPATSDLRRTVGLVTERGQYAIFLDRIPVQADVYRLQADGRTFEIVGAAVWPSHTLAICEVLS